MRIELPVKVQQIINRITKAGYEAYAVGGCIRDSILGRMPDDWDITTSATPQQVKQLFTRTVDTGIKHGTVTVLLEKEGFEVTTYRIDGKYEDGRHPTEVTFTPNLEEDLKRRDFTMNALAYNQEAGLVDLFGGKEDMEKGIIRCVGNPMERFTEDALRMMRAIRFAAQLGYEIEENTREAICRLAPNLRQISAERIQVELTKLVVSAHPEAIRTICETGVAAVVLPELMNVMEISKATGEHILRSMKEVLPRKELRLAMLFHEIAIPQCYRADEGKEKPSGNCALVSADMAKSILRRLRYDNDTINTVYRLVLYHTYGEDILPDRRMVRWAMNKIGEDLFPMLFEVKRADVLAGDVKCREEKLKWLSAWEQLYEEILKRQECVSLKTLALTGRDLIELGMKPGKELGETLNRLLELVLDQPQLNTRENLIQWLPSIEDRFMNAQSDK